MVSLNSQDLKNELVARLHKSAHAFLEATRNETDGSPLYAFGFFADSGCVSVQACISSEAALRLREKAADASERDLALAATHAVEWEHIARHRDTFAQANAHIDEILRIMDDGTLDDVEIADMPQEAFLDFQYGLFADAFSQALERLKAERVFQPPRFAADVLLGVFFSDPGAYDLRVLEAVSQRVNSPAWHARVRHFVSLSRGEPT